MSGIETKYPALWLWQAEMRQGRRGAYTADALWRAACAEAAARDFLSDRIPDITNKLLVEAAEIILQAGDEFTGAA